MNKEYIEIGKIVNTFGLKGELKIQSESDFIDYRFRKGALIYLKMGRIIKEYTVSSYRILKGNVVVTLNNMFDINLIENLVGSIVLAKKDDIPPLKEGEYMIDDLVGLKVFDQSNNYLGILKDVIILPSSDVLEIENENHKNILIPFVDEYILEVSSEKIIVKVLEVDND